MKKFNLTPPSGFPEFTSAENQIRENWLATIREIFKKYGFAPIETPIVERAENLLEKGGNKKEMYALARLHPDSADSEAEKSRALRFDHTVPLALFVARHLQKINFPFRRYAIGSVFRGERAQKGRFRQFEQCDIDIIGSPALAIENDAEIMAITLEIFKKILPDCPVVVRLNNRKILAGFFETCQIKPPQIPEIIRIIDDLEKIGEEKVQKNLANKKIPEKIVQKILNFTKITGKNDEIIEKLEKIAEKDSKPANSSTCELATGIAELKIVIQTLRAMQVPEKNLQIDLAIARGLDYYTGTIFETHLLDHKNFGSVASGGRYDNLGEIFAKKPLPGVGIGIGLTRLLSQCLAEKLVEPKNASPAEILVVAIEPKFHSTAISTAQKLRKNGVSVQNYFENRKLPKVLDYAEKNGARFVAIVGKNEEKSGKISIKNLETGEKFEIDPKNKKEIQKILQN